MIYIQEVETYIQYTKEHPDEINEDRKKLISNIVIPTLESPQVFFDRKRYDNCIKYCETNYYKLFEYERFLYAFVFLFNEHTFETTFFRTFFIMMGRGNGKDAIIMPLVNFLQTPLNGIKNYHVDIIANEEKQCKDSFSVVYDMLEDNAKKFKGKFRWTKEEIVNLKTRSILRYNTSNAKTKDGKRTGAIVANEIHGYENFDQVNVFSSGLGKIPHPRTFIITTNGFVRDGALDKYVELSEKVLNGGDNKLRIFPFICRVDSIDEIYQSEDEEVLEKVFRKANPSMQFRKVLRDQIFQDFYEMQEIPDKKPEFIAKRLNLVANQTETAVATWENILATTYEDIELKTPIKDDFDLSNQPCVVGIDYADICDFASAGCLFNIDGTYVWRQHTWICRNSRVFNEIKFPLSNCGIGEFQDFEIVDADSISEHLITDWVYEQTQKYYVKRIIMDNYKFKLMKQSFERYGIKTFNEKQKKGMVEMVRAMDSVSAFNEPIITKAFADHKINFGPSAIMRWYSNNVKVVARNGKMVFKKIEPRLRKTDGFMAFNCAMFRKELTEQKVFIVNV